MVITALHRHHCTLSLLSLKGVDWLHHRTEGICARNAKVLQLLMSASTCWGQTATYNLIKHARLLVTLQGVPEERLRAEIATVLQRTALPLEMAARPAGQYSGGSKRKLALGIALVGGSSTILLDEPSSGMVRCPSCGHTLPSPLRALPVSRRCYIICSEQD